MLTVIRRLGLTNGLKLCLDAGHETSLPAASTKWLDLSGNGFDFFRGTTAGADATDPAINGTPGRRSSSEYLSFDGGDFLRYDAANETWMQNIHKDNAKFTLLSWLYWGANGTPYRWVGTRGAGSGTGFLVAQSSSGNMTLSVQNAGANGLTYTTSVIPGFALNTWSFAAVSLNEAVGANGAIMMINDGQELITSTYVSPSAGNATEVMEIGALGGGGTPMPAGSRMSSFAAWEGVALSAEQLRAMYQATRGKFGV